MLEGQQQSSAFAMTFWGGGGEGRGERQGRSCASTNCRHRTSVIVVRILSLVDSP